MKVLNNPQIVQQWNCHSCFVFGWNSWRMSKFSLHWISGRLSNECMYYLAQVISSWLKWYYLHDLNIQNHEWLDNIVHNTRIKMFYVHISYKRNHWESMRIFLESLKNSKTIVIEKLRKASGVLKENKRINVGRNQGEIKKNQGGFREDARRDSGLLKWKKWNYWRDIEEFKKKHIGIREKIHQKWRFSSK